MESHHFDCECHSPEHTLRFLVDDDYIYTAVYLNQYKGFFGRVWAALKYVLGTRRGDGHFDEFLLQAKDAPHLRAVIDEFAPNCPTCDAPYLCACAEGPTEEEIRNEELDKAITWLEQQRGRRIGPMRLAQELRDTHLNTTPS